MRRIGAVVLVGMLAVGALAACSSGGPASRKTVAGGPVSFRVLRAGHNPQACVDTPDSAVALDEDSWINVFDRQTECLPEPEITLPRVRFGSEVGLAIWWRLATCEASAVRIASVERRGDELIVSARTDATATCPTTLGALESFLALQRSELYDGTQALVLDLDGEPVAP